MAAAPMARVARREEVERCSVGVIVTERGRQLCMLSGGGDTNLTSLCQYISFSSSSPLYQWYQSHKEAATFILQQQDSMSSDNNFVQPAIPRFDGHYDHWSMLMENFLRSKEYWSIVESGIQVPATDAVLNDVQKINLEGRKLKDLKAKNYLFQATDRPILETILSKETSKDIWDSMKKKYQGSARVKRAQLQALRRDFETLQMKDGESVTSYCARTMEISNKMRFHGEKMGDVTIVEKILHSMTPKFDYVVCSIEESKDLCIFS
ncbi:hypothetical protein ZIOFF_012711 [Zingiber officinale]|uniref:Retrovirus-related Pol polyprotein from transposon TNT 1-94 n=1 Tax=Zingiber officinale TaxID=94328 RepID=A0A8J5I0B2_ZINOF|nr:hypothetical protein ZIOFF_012711 [Zingiber officinale]